MKKTICTLLTLAMTLAMLASCGAAEVQKPIFEVDDYNTVIAMIDSISEASFETEAAIDEAYTIYNTLHESEKAKVTNYEKLEQFQNDLVDLYNTSERRGGRINRNKLLIGTYCFNFNDEEHVKELADAGFDFITATGYDQTKLDNLAKYGIGAFISGLPSWRGGDRLPEDPQPEPTLSMETYTEAVKAVTDHEAIWGIDIIDEPSALDYPFLNQQCQVIYEEKPEYLAYINLHPGHGRARLGTENEIMLSDGMGADYREYIAKYVENVDIDFICYDHYFYQNGVPSENEYANSLFMHKVISQACYENDKDFWVVMQLNSRDNQSYAPVQLSQEQLQIQAFNALAFGAKAINWACWQPGWWTFNVYDSAGNRTEQYEKVKAVNEILNLISPIYMKYKYIDTCTLGRRDHDRSDMEKYMDNELDQDTFTNLEADGLSFVVAGYFEKQVGSMGKAMMLVNVSDKMTSQLYPHTATVSFEINEPDAVVTAYIMGKPVVLTPVNGVYTVHIENAEFAFVTVE